MGNTKWTLVNDVRMDHVVWASLAGVALGSVGTIAGQAVGVIGDLRGKQKLRRENQQDLLRSLIQEFLDAAQTVEERAMDVFYGNHQPSRQDTHQIWMLCRMLEIVGPTSLEKSTVAYTSCIDVLMWQGKNAPAPPLEIMNGPRQQFLEAAKQAIGHHSVGV